MNRFKKIIKNPYFIISFVYLITNLFLLLLSGCWWDDWTFMSHDLVYINQVASQSGRPEWNLLIPLCWSMTNNGRILIFFMFYLDSLFLFNILKNSKIFNEKQSLIISLLFIVIPVNDARLLISNFPYSVGLFFFFLALMLFVRWNNSKKNIFVRLIVLLLFFISFILNSLLAFYYIIFIYLFILDLIQNKEKTLIKKVLISIKNVLIKYPDFFILPFVYFVATKALFPITGDEFGGRSSITINGLLKCIKYIPLSMINIVKDIFRQFINCLSFLPVLFICIVLVIIIFKSKYKENNENNKNLIWVFVFGIIAFVLGIFAYVEIRGRALDSIGVKGRDAILAPFGIALIIYSILCIFKEKIRYSICAVIIVLGICSINLLYIEWQKDYYCQLSIEKNLNNEIVRKNDTFFLANLNESYIEAERYYSLNTNANHVFGDETRFFIPKVSNLYMLTSKDEIESAKTILNGSQMMKDYNPEDYNLDAVLIYDGELNWKQAIELKYYELFDYNKFEDGITKIGSMEIIEVEDSFTKKLLTEKEKGNINSDNDVVELLEVSYN